MTTDTPRQAFDPGRVVAPAALQDGDECGHHGVILRGCGVANAPAPGPSRTTSVRRPTDGRTSPRTRSRRPRPAGRPPGDHAGSRRRPGTRCSGSRVRYSRAPAGGAPPRGALRRGCGPASRGAQEPQRLAGPADLLGHVLLGGEHGERQDEGLGHPHHRPIPEGRIGQPLPHLPTAIDQGEVRDAGPRVAPNPAALLKRTTQAAASIAAAHVPGSGALPTRARVRLADRSPSSA